MNLFRSLTQTGYGVLSSPHDDPAAGGARGNGVVYGSYGPQARRSSVSSRPAGSAGPAGAAGQRGPGAAALLRCWLRALTPDAWVSAHDRPHPLTVLALRWAPLAAPLLAGGLALALTLAVRAGRPHGPTSPLPTQAVIPTLLLALLLGCVIQGLALYVAPNGVLWCLALFGGGPLLLALAFTLAFGAPGGLLALAVCAAVLLLYSVWRMAPVPTGEVAVTLLLGEWYRTLPSGYNIRLPGERVIARLRVSPRAFTTEMRRVTLDATRMAQARATVAYLVDTRAAWRTAQVRATWEQELRQRVGEALSASLVAQATAHGPSGSIARGVLDETRAWARSVGVRILSVRAHDIAIGSPDELPSPRQPAAASAPRAQAGMQAAGAARRTSEPRPAPLPVRPPGQPLMVVSPPPTPAADRPSPEALEDLYSAIRNRQITDTQVIREIAGHFAAYAAEASAARQATPFDAVAAARLLNEYADALDVARPTARARSQQRSGG